MILKISLNKNQFNFVILFIYMIKSYHIHFFIYYLLLSNRFMNTQNIRSPKNTLKKTKSVSSFSKEKCLFNLPTSIQALKFNNQFTVRLPSYVSPTKLGSIPSSIAEYLRSGKMIQQISPKKSKNKVNHVQDSFLEKCRKNSVFTTYKERQNKLESKIQSARKISMHLRENEFNLKKKLQFKEHQKQQLMNPEIQRIKNFSQTISTNSSGKNFSQSLQLSDFVVGKKIGTGKYGQVFMTRHKKTGTIFALKKISKVNLTEEIKNQLIYQIKIQSFLDHPNVIKLYGFFSDSENIYLLMELCTSGHLFNLLKEVKALPQKSSKIVIKQLSQGLDYLHHNKIIHRDLKLENILYHFGMIKICDFGWSTISETLRQTFCGTPLYISPELLQRKDYDNKIDIWSIGILAYELIFGKVPFQINSKEDFCKIVQDELEFPQYPYISEEGRAFLKGCLLKNPSQRLQIMQLIHHQFLSNCQTSSSEDLY